jgi:hypothetical protein
LDAGAPEAPATAAPGPPWDRWLLVRRHKSKPDRRAYYLVFGPADTILATLARVTGRRRAIEACFEVAKQEVGPADCEIRSRHGWHRHVILALLDPGPAGAGLPRGDARHAQSRRRRRDGERQKGAARARSLVDFSTNEIRPLISRLQQLAGLTLEPVPVWSLRRRLHQAAAQICHWKQPRNGTPSDLQTQLWY